jgi:purine-binding chemotaxis protein CheW
MKRAGPGSMGKKLKLYKDESRPEDKGRIYVFFQLAGEKYAVGIDIAEEILKPKEITEIPHTPDFLIGVLNLRGKIVPVVDLRLRFGLTENELSKSTRIIVAAYKDQPIGLLVDAVLSVQPIPDSKIESTPEMISSAIDSDYFDGVANIDGQMIIILNLNKALRKTMRNLPAHGRAVALMD